MSIILDKNRGRKRPLNRSIKKKGQLSICQTREAYRAFSRLVDSIYEDSLRAVLRLPAGGAVVLPGGLSREDDPFRPEGMVYSDSRSAPGAPPLDAPDPAGGNPLG